MIRGPVDHVIHALPGRVLRVLALGEITDPGCRACEAFRIELARSKTWEPLIDFLWDYHMGDCDDGQGLVCYLRSVYLYVCADVEIMRRKTGLYV